MFETFELYPGAQGEVPMETRNASGSANELEASAIEMHIVADLHKGCFLVWEAWPGTTILCL